MKNDCEFTNINRKLDYAQKNVLNVIFHCNMWFHFAVIDNKRSKISRLGENSSERRGLQ